jgi:DNA-binding NarL/FixJ family response regulator
LLASALVGGQGATLRKRATIILADEHRLFREGLRKLLDDEDLQVVAEAGNGRQLLAHAAKLRPNCAVIDIALPELNGLDAIRILSRDAPHTKVVVLTVESMRRYVAEAIRLGVSGYVLKTGSGEELKAAIRAAVEGTVYLSPEIAATLASELRTRDRDGSSPNALTGREREVLQLLGEGKRLGEIAQTLHISIKTVKNHRDRIGSKLGSRSTAELVKQAIRLGLTVS